MGLIQPEIERGRNLLGPNFFYFASFCVQKFQLCLFPKKINMNAASKPPQHPWTWCRRIEGWGQQTWHRRNRMCLISFAVFLSANWVFSDDGMLFGHWFVYLALLPLPVVFILPLVRDLVRARYPIGVVIVHDTWQFPLILKLGGKYKQRI